jgi:signal transduction histidine kinase
MTWTAESVESGLLPLPAVHTLRSVLREAVQNALRHGKARAIAIEVRLHEGRLRLSVQDDGIGFDAVAVVPGNGLANMQARVSSLGGEFHVRSGAGGTRIEAHFPVNRQARAR